MKSIPYVGRDDKVNANDKLNWPSLQKFMASTFSKRAEISWSHSTF